MSRKHGSHEYPGDDRLCFEMARLIQGGYVEDPWDAARRLAHLAEQKSYGTSLRGRELRLWRRYIRDETRWLTGPPPVARGNLRAALRSMERGFAHMRWLERKVQERAATEESAAAVELMSQSFGINVASAED